MTSQMLLKEAFFKALIGARSNSHSSGHPFSLAWKNGKISRAQLGLWATQHYYYIEQVSQQFAAMFARMPDLDARQHVLENMLGEETPDARHPDLMLKFAKACGLDPQAVKDAALNGEVLPGTMAMRAWVWELAAIRPLAEAAAGITVALEGQTPTLFPAYIETGRKMGFSDDDLEFFHVHVEEDTSHEGHGLEICHRYATTPELQRSAIAVVGASARMRFNMLNGIYEAAVMANAA
jgi:pyrroloquinoline-quinone synthase